MQFDIYPKGFNTQPPEGGWAALADILKDLDVSTHSRPKAAGGISRLFQGKTQVSTHSRPKAAGYGVSCRFTVFRFQHTAARRRLGSSRMKGYRWLLFQHTAARRRLVKRNQTVFSHKRFNTQPPEGGWTIRPHKTKRSVVSTHSRPKAAGLHRLHYPSQKMFQHTAARRRLDVRCHPFQGRDTVSTHSRPKAAGSIVLI